MPDQPKPQGPVDVVGLLTQARAGDGDARNDLFEHCRAYVGFLARSHVESWLQAKVDASDLIQQTMMDAHRGLNEFEGQSEGEWLAWLKQILRHNATDFIRRFGAAKRNAGLEREFSLGHSSMFRNVPEPEGFEETPSAIVTQKEEELLVANALAKLTEDHQEVIVLRNLQRLPFDQIAERMGRTRPAVQMLWARAMKRLQEVVSQLSIQS